MKSKEITIKDEMTEFLLYTTSSGKVKVEIFFHNENVWLTQKRMAELFGVDRSVITKHLKNIFESQELEEKSVSAKIAHTAKDGKEYQTMFYNLDAILSVGYRVNSNQATQFRIWATTTLREYMIKGFVLDDERLKNGKNFGKNYFRELLERIRSIRASERQIYQQITDIFAECSLDYNPSSQTTKTFYATIQNKFHYAIHGKTAPELIYNKVDIKKPHMGLQTWKNSPDGRVLKSDTTIAKNYLSEEQIKDLERTISSFFDYIETLIKNRTAFKMKDFASSVNNFLNFYEFRILDNLGKISKQKAESKAHEIYDEFNKTQKIESDFDKEIKKLK